MKLPFSVLVVVHTAEMDVLLLERAARPGFWQSVTGSLDRLDEPYEAAAARELREETGIAAAAGELKRWDVAYTFEIYPHWRHRFAPGVTHNTEQLFSLSLPERAPVTIAPAEHTAFAWLPWREAARRCFSWSNRDAILTVGAALLAAGCAGSGGGLAPHLESGSAEVRDCARWYRALDAEIDAAGVRDAQYTRVPGFPHLRVDRLHAALRERAAEGAGAMRAFGERLGELDLESRRHEVRNLPTLDDARRRETLRRAEDCGRLMRAADLESLAARAALLRAAQVPDDYSTCTRRFEDAMRKVFEREADPAANRVRFSPPLAAPMPRNAVAGLIGRAAFDPLGQPALSARELERIAVTYAPSFDVEIAADHDRFGWLRWRRGSATPEVDASEPAVYVHSAYTRYGGDVLLQLVYTLWFGGRLDGVVWRVTLAPDGEPLIYDSIHACGCYHFFFPTPRARLRPAPAGLEDRAFVPQALPRVAEGERPVVTLASRTHHIERVSMAREGESLVRYSLRAYDELRSLPRAGGAHASVFGPDGVIAGAGAMRQWGRQATAFVGRRHFDDADLFERRFELR